MKKKTKNLSQSVSRKKGLQALGLVGALASAIYFMENNAEAVDVKSENSVVTVFEKNEEFMQLQLQINSLNPLGEFLAIADAREKTMVAVNDVSEQMFDANAISFIQTAQIDEQLALQEKILAAKKFEEEQQKAEQLRKEKEEAERKRQLEEQAKKEAVQKASASQAVLNKGYIPNEHFNYLVIKVDSYGLDLRKTMAVMKHESNFNPNAISATNDYGYFQINTVNHQRLSSLLGTNNAPLNPYVNIDWGTYMLADLTKVWTEAGLTGKALDEAVLSSYNKGLTGYKKYGKATAYLEKWQTAYNNL